MNENFPKTNLIKKLVIILGVAIISGSILFAILNQQQTETPQIDQADIEIPGEPLVQPSNFATQIISDCSNDLDCALNSLREIYDTTDEETVISTVKQLLNLYEEDRSIRCHETAHQMGMFLYPFVGENLSKAFEYAGQSCGGAIYHGVIMNFFATELGNSVNPDEIEILDICPEFEENPYELERWQCLHGVGHGLQVAYDHDTFTAIERCEIFEPGWEQISCNKGVFMENSQHEYYTGEGNFDENDILYPCNQVDLKYAPACYHYQPTYILKQYDAKVMNFFKDCDKIVPQELIKYCYHGIGRQLIPDALQSVNLINLVCQAGQPEFQNDCYRGMVMTLINNDRNPLEGFVFCQVIPDTAKEDCYDGLGKWIIMSYSSEMDREKACSQAESDEYFETCMNATLENIRLL